MKQYAIIRNSCEVSARTMAEPHFPERWEVENGVTLSEGNYNEPEILLLRKTKEEAQEALKGYESYISRFRSRADGISGYYVVAEYYVQEITIHPEIEDGNKKLEMGEVLEFSPFIDFTPEPEQEECLEP